jgi:transposase
MLSALHTARIWLCTSPTDMRCSYNGLSALVKHRLQQNPLSGDLFVFINRKRTQMKVLYFESGGYCIWAKRLEQGTFAASNSKEISQDISWAKLKCLLEGIDITVVKQRLRYNKYC